MDQPTRFAQLHRPLDFTAVTDHAEFLGEIRTCLTPGLPGYDDPNCEATRTELASPPAGITQPLPLIVIAFQLTIQDANPMRFSLCGPDGSNCTTQAALVWQDELDAAEEFYDRTDACAFTTFPAYEWTNNLNGYNLHRNIIFRNAEVPPLPTSYYEQPLVEGLFGVLENECLDAPGNCDFVSIPHNSNVSGGLMFQSLNGDGSPMTSADAARRAGHEPLVEIFQHKGSSECQPSTSPNDELCGFEQLQRPQLFANTTQGLATLPASNFVRNALERGLQLNDALGVNPFELGFVGSTDGHQSLPGGVVEEDFGTTGHLGVRDGSAENILSNIAPGGIVTNGGGLAVLWAEENSRDALFAAMRRREAYATSGTRPIVRFFAGRPPKTACDDPSFVEEGYTSGVPMGGEIGPTLGRRSPRFAVMAMQDPGGNGEPSTPLQRMQIVKGWVDDAGQAHERVFEVAGDPHSDASVDIRHVRDQRHRLRVPLHGLGRPDVPSRGARLLLRPRPREPGLPLEHAPLQLARRRLHALLVGAHDLPQLLRQSGPENHPGTRLDVADLLPTRGVRHQGSDSLRQGADDRPPPAPAHDRPVAVGRWTSPRTASRSRSATTTSSTPRRCRRTRSSRARRAEASATTTAPAASTA